MFSDFIGKNNNNLPPMPPFYCRNSRKQTVFLKIYKCNIIAKMIFFIYLCSRNAYIRHEFVFQVYL